MDRTTILNLLNKFSKDRKDISWKMKCIYSDGMGTTINEIKIIAQPGNRSIGIFTYRIETGMVLFCMYNDMQRSHSGEIIDVLLDMMNYSKGHIID